MIDFAHSISEDIPFVRVDFYDVEGKPQFSEMTLHPCFGFMPFNPKEWNRYVGEMLSLKGMSASRRGGKCRTA